MESTVLIVDDEEGIRESLSGILEDEGYEVLSSSSGEEALKALKEQSPDLILLDVWLPGIDGIKTLKEIKGLKPDLPVIMISGHGNIELAVKATRMGAYDFLEKPLSLERVLLAAKRAIEKRTLEMEYKAIKQDFRKKWKLTGDSQKMKQVREQINMAAQSNSRVLILGESGSGKELVAHILHDNSNRAEKPFIEMNCAAIPQELIESELFGHEKGSFTGAFEKKKGKFELADEGTLFLDEVGDMSLSTQSKVLRVLETQEFQRVGGSRDIKVDVRIIAATNKDLIEEIRKGNFREDLLYRLNVIPIVVPALRSRKEDIPTLVEYFFEYFAAEYGQRPKKITSEGLKMLEAYDWPGNIRELRNVIERLVIMTPSNTITPKNLIIGESARSDYFAFKTLREARESFEKDFITKKLEENNWNISKTAEVLDVERSNLHRKIKAYDIKTP
ncbi:MAG: Fis family transcriptional regulator [Nitrospirae bacterium CG_4_10_14_0_8_um_filter_41_23]|nr:sigma-54-dependent Fis family transcriptional regulator [Nitrospirota bacterium]PIQ93635.1 MAG: Fis family transcriptional regulator [Nitrospirae bacterium CG11_big_fil_rev_8_21_14_0_20_41_14]PIV41539.1 MAG: Fis family transcriptional regulator [Nitrospirae bacterium CG02_land_8_20_14_3_00_41_53]PIW88001.1 MAG: Fis family transcriptional regulator [Nitrospirae bacterium CG_4_8_14_3_um_filter_41_47]PIY85981.1 MAG: Fis family transcriptional regulator [Nitrospirae bacterium CG_4_10_14_0_8_um_f